jgi:hypothetical protein
LGFWHKQAKSPLEQPREVAKAIMLSMQVVWISVNLMSYRWHTHSTAAHVSLSGHDGSKGEERKLHVEDFNDRLGAFRSLKCFVFLTTTTGDEDE